jgi:hypothetical protein
MKALFRGGFAARIAPPMLAKLTEPLGSIVATA